MMLNKAFENHLDDVIDDEELMKLRKMSAYAQCMREFNDKIKPNFSFSKPQSSRVTFPGARLTPDRNFKLESSALTLTGSDLQRMFQSVSSEISKSIRAQIRSVELKNKAIMELGGDAIVIKARKTRSLPRQS